MGIIKLQLPEQLRETIGRKVAEGRVASESDFLVEAAHWFAEDLDGEEEIVAEAKAGIADAEAGRYMTIASAEDVNALHERLMNRVRAELAADLG